MKRIAVYPGSFDPITLGHEDIITRASTMFDIVIVALGINSTKTPMIKDTDRFTLLEKSADRLNYDILGARIIIGEFSGLLVNYAAARGAKFIVRGLRAVTDFEYELGIAYANKSQQHDIETVFLPTNPNLSFVSSSVVRELVRHRGDISQFVSKHVEDFLRSNVY